MGHRRHRRGYRLIRIRETSRIILPPVHLARYWLGFGAQAARRAKFWQILANSPGMIESIHRCLGGQRVALPMTNRSLYVGRREPGNLNAFKGGERRHPLISECPLLNFGDHTLQLRLRPVRFAFWDGFHSHTRSSSTPSHWAGGEPPVLKDHPYLHLLPVKVGRQLPQVRRQIARHKDSREKRYRPADPPASRLAIPTDRQIARRFGQRIDRANGPKSPTSTCVRGEPSNTLTKRRPEA